MKPTSPTPLRPFAALALSTLLSACGPQPAPPVSPPRSVSPANTAAPPRPAPAASVPAAAPAEATGEHADQGRRIVAQAFGVLSSNLVAALARGPASNALEFCAVNVGPLTAGVVGPQGVTLRRVSHRARNPDNQANPAELALIESYRTALAAGHTNPPVLLTNALGSVRFYAPILLQNPLCLQCHGQPGSEIAAGTLSTIDRLYPQDAARGFRLGEVRGLWSVTFPAQGPAPRVPPLPGPP